MDLFLISFIEILNLNSSGEDSSSAESSSEDEEEEEDDDEETKGANKDNIKAALEIP